MGWFMYTELKTDRWIICILLQPKLNHVRFLCIRNYIVEV